LASDSVSTLASDPGSFNSGFSSLTFLISVFSLNSGTSLSFFTISGKLRGDRSAFEKHSAGILPRAGHHAEVIVDEAIAHVKTAMGLIGIRIRIAKKERLVPEFKLKTEIKNVKEEKPELKEPGSEAKVETESEAKVETESEAKVETE